MTHKFLKIFLISILGLFYNSQAMASECTPGKSERRKPSLSPGMLPTLDVPSYKKRLAEAPERISTAKNLSKTSTLNIARQKSLLRSGISAAGLNKDHATYVELAEKLLALDAKPMPLYAQKGLADAYVKTGQPAKAHPLYSAWFSRAQYVRKKDHKNMAQAAEAARALDAAILFSKCQLPLNKRNVKRKGELHLDLIRLGAQGGDRSSVENFVENFQQFLLSKMRGHPLSNDKYIELGMQILSGTDFPDLASILNNTRDSQAVTPLITKSKTYFAKCFDGSAKDCMVLARLYKGEPLYEEDYFLANQRACELGDPNGCYAEAVSRYYGVARARDEALAHTLFAAACSEGVGDACHGAALKYGSYSQSPNIVKARAYYKKGCDLKSVRSCFSLANKFRSPRDGTTKPDIEQAIKYYKKACKLGEGIACTYAENLR